ncbi:hypothetical protein [Sphingobacterium faecium]
MTLFNKKFIFFSFILLLINLHAKSQENHKILINNIINAMHSYKTVSYDYSRVVRQPSVGISNDFQGKIFFSFTKNLLGSKFIFENDLTKDIYDGNTACFLDKTTKELSIRENDIKALMQYAFLKNSYYTLRNFFPRIIERKDIKIVTRDTSILSKDCFVLEFNIPNTVINNLGELQSVPEENHLYTILIDKKLFLPIDVFRKNLVNDDYVHCKFNNIILDQVRDNAEFRYESYLGEYHEVKTFQF